MTQPASTKLHSVYLVDHVGDTLVVQPRGDAAGFSIQSVNSEMATITQLAAQPEVKHLLVDLAGGRYFGSVILGSLVQLNQVVRSRGGRVGLCGASSDMLDVLRLMKLEQMWEMFPTLPAGLTAIAKIPVRERLWRKRKSFAILGAIALGVALYVYYPRPNYARINYEKLHGLWQEVESRRTLAGDEEWTRLQKRMEKELEPIIADMERRGKAGNVSMAERFLIYIARDEWKFAVDRNNTQRDGHAAIIRKYFRTAEALMEKRPIPGFTVDDAFQPAEPAAPDLPNPGSSAEGTPPPALPTPQ